MFKLTVLQQLVKLIPRAELDAMIERTGADKHRKGFGVRSHLITMLYAQLSGARSLRQIEQGFNAIATHHYHLGVNQVRRSTLAQTNQRASTAPFHALCQSLIKRLKGTRAANARQSTRELGALLQIVDSTSLTLKGKGFDKWTAQNATRHCQGLKVHLTMDHAQESPLQVGFSAPTMNDIEWARTQIALGHAQSSAAPAAAPAAAPEAQHWVFDRGYCDYHWWDCIAQAGEKFTTRLKSNAAYAVGQTHALTAEHIEHARAQGFTLTDQTIALTNKNPGAGRTLGYRAPLRCVTVVSALHTKPWKIVTNDFAASALQVALRYQARWKIELLFKWIKQHLNITQPVGRSENAVKIQVLVAIIAYLLVLLQKQSTRFEGTAFALLTILRSTLLTRPSVYTETDRRRRERNHEISQRQTKLAW